MARPIKQSCLDAGHARFVRPDGVSECRDCRRQTNARVRAAKYDYVNEIKLTSGCVRCGFRDHPHALHLHHRDPAEKDLAVCEMVKRGWKRLRAEVAKCDVICANCHAILHAEERAAAATP